MNTAYIFDYPVHLISPEEGKQEVFDAVSQEKNCHVVTLNPEMIMQASLDQELAEILKSAHIVLPDGAGLVWALRHRGHPAKRLPGIEFSEALLSLASENKYRVAFIGAQEDTLNQAVSHLMVKYPGIDVVYTHHGYFQPNEDQVVAVACAQSHPHFVFVALGVPRQEKFIARFISKFRGTTLVGVGGTLDVWSGQKRRAPKLFRALNLEWLYRITSEPWRLKRTYKTLPLFVVKVLLSKT